MAGRGGSLASHHFYTRAAVPVDEKIVLEVQYKDFAGFRKDTDEYPTIEILDAAGQTVFGPDNQSVVRMGDGRYKLDFLVPDGFDANGLWTDIWTGSYDGYQIQQAFDFTVSNAGTVEATGQSVPERIYTLDDEDIEETLSQCEIKGILKMRKFLKMRLRSTAFKADGSPCPLVGNDTLDLALRSALSEFNLTPTITHFSFCDNWITSIAQEVITQGALIQVWMGQAPIEAGRELVLNDNGVSYQPPPVSSTITGLINAQLADYRAKLRSVKSNLRPAPRSFGAGSVGVSSPYYRRLRTSLKEKQII